MIISDFLKVFQIVITRKLYNYHIWLKIYTLILYKKTTTLQNILSAILIVYFTKAILNFSFQKFQLYCQRQRLMNNKNKLSV
jgi:hypothetical protein